MIKAIHILLYFALLFPACLTAQIRFNKVYPDSTSTTFSGLVSVDDGYIICGEIIKNGYRNITFVKTNLWGEVQWRKYYGKLDITLYTGIDNCFFKLRQGGFALAGCHESDSLYRKTLLMILDENCDTLFTKTYVIPDRYQFALGGIQTYDKGFALAGISNDYLPETSEIDCFLLRTDSLGNKMWHQTYGGGSTDHFYSVAETADSGFIVAGRTYSFNTGTYPGDWYLVKTDISGNQIWDATYGSALYNDGVIFDLLKTKDGKYIITGPITYNIDNNSDYRDEEARIIKFDDLNNVFFDKTYSENVDYLAPYDSSHCWFMGITEAKDSSLAAICRIRHLTNIEYSKLYVMDHLGDTMFTRKISNPIDSSRFYGEWLNVIESTDDGGYVMAGLVDYFGIEPSKQMWIVKTDSCGFYGEAEANLSYIDNELEVSFCNDSKHADSCIWDFGDGSNALNSPIGLNPVHVYADTGTYLVTLDVYNSCYPEVRDTFSVEIHVTDVGIADKKTINDIKIYPNPANNTVTIESENNTPKEIEIYSILGQRVFKDEFNNRKKTIDCSVLKEGVYIVRLKNHDSYINIKLVISR